MPNGVCVCVRACVRACVCVSQCPLTRCSLIPQNGQLQQRLDNVERDFIIFNREK